ncbi:MAG TPA: glycosyltransferase family 39 protein [Thermoanaerobaculia bacterium]|jgi:hypothetical protein
MTNGRWWALLSLLIVLTLARVAATHRVFAQTLDEGAHVISGYDALTRRVFTTDPLHPPLARMLFALPFVGEPNPAQEPRANELFLRGGRYEANLARARMGNLLFLAMGIVAVALWARRLFGDRAALLAALLYASLPPILAHAGLATTDMAAAATLPLALYALTRLLDEASWSRAIVVGVTIGIGLLSKYSFVINLPACALVLLIVRRRAPLAKLLAAGAIAALLVIAVMPPRAFVDGLIALRAMSADPPTAILFGKVRKGGWWYYFPVALAVKTPIPFLALALTGCAFKRTREVSLIAAVILAIAMSSRINIGVRHLLPLYAPLAIAAASVRVRWLVIACSAWLVIGSALAHPDYLPWFNAFAGREPQRVLNDSNLDWGQDVLRLVRYARTEQLPSITTSLATFAPLDRLGLPPRKDLEVFQPVHGYVAISELNIALAPSFGPEVQQWVDELLRGRKYRRIGKSIRLYHFD